jgi:hypothetical protein
MGKSLNCIYAALIFMVIGLWTNVLLQLTRLPGSETQSTFWYRYFQSEDAGFNVLKGKLDELKGIEGDFAFEDRQALLDKEKMIRSKTVVEGTVKAYNEFFDAQKGTVDALKSSYGGPKQAPPRLQEAYDSVAEDFKDLKGIMNNYGDTMVKYLDFVILHSGDMEAGPDGVAFKSEGLADRFAVLEKNALDATTSLNDDQDKVRDKLGYDFGVFADELKKL